MLASKDCFLSSYDYELDSDRIAQVPLNPRHNARLLIVEQEKEHLAAARHVKIWDLQKELRAGDLVVVNDTRVLKARLRARRSGGGLSELLLLEPLKEGRWLCLARPAKRMRVGDYLWIEALEQKPIRVQVVGNDEESGGRLVQFPSCYFDRES